MTNVVKPDFAIEAKLRDALFGVFHDSGETFNIFVRADGKNTIPMHVKRDASDGFVMLEINRGWPSFGCHHDAHGLFIMGLSFNRIRYDVEIPWSEVAALGRVRSGPMFTFNTSLGETELMGGAKPKPEAEAKKAEGNVSKVIRLADFRRKPT